QIADTERQSGVGGGRPSAVKTDVEDDQQRDLGRHRVPRQERRQRRLQHQQEPGRGNEGNGPRRRHLASSTLVKRTTTSSRRAKSTAGSTSTSCHRPESLRDTRATFPTAKLRGKPSAPVVTTWSPSAA